jgi:hypothetical protein
VPNGIIRIRIAQLPNARDLEYLALRYVRVSGVYNVPLALAHDLIESGCASAASDSDPLTDIVATDVDEDESEDE